MKILIIFCTHNITTTLKFFLKHGYYNASDTDFYICLNNPTLNIDPLITDIKQNANFHVLNRENIGLDFGAWSEVLLKDDLYKQYTHFIFINNSCMGPFTPTYVKDRWTDLLIGQLNDQTKLVGPTINHYNGKPHIQSYCLCTDHIGLQIGLNNKIFCNEINEYGKDHNYSHLQHKIPFIEFYEVGYSLLILDAGYNIKCMMRAFHNVDFRLCRRVARLTFKYGDGSGDMTYNGAYFGINIHPYEVMFFKCNRGVSPDVLQKYLAFYDL